MAGQTMIEKLLSRKANAPIEQGEIAITDVDLLVSHDGNRPQATDVFYEMGGKRVFDPDKVKLVIDHAPAIPNQRASEVHAQMRKFAKNQDVEIIGPGEGICHQIIAEKGQAIPGDLILGTDSHTCTHGALNAIGIGVGTSDLAAALLTGKIWLKIPDSIQIVLDGTFPRGVHPKDVALEFIRILRADGATYKVLEFTGEALSEISVSGRMTIANMAVEAGAKASIFPYDSILDEWLSNRQLKDQPNPVYPDEDANYTRKIRIDISKLKPKIALPEQVENVVDGSETQGIEIQQAVIGTCTNGRLEDLQEAAAIIKGKQVAKGVRLFITPASRETYIQAIEQGIIEIFVKAGAVIGVPGCSGCSGGAHFAIPSDGDNVITAANRNFVGRLGNPKANIYLASPELVALSAVTGVITLPEERSVTT